ncbi:tyrosine-type recombinase/integrase [Bacillus paranthracis]|uniref:tyrosine-type recombinase/integrase n=1 Tax=Bacillus paranthracis TaxID=2026186 RepID=UPI000D6BFC6E|nr:tyrosine-type recombinase/integrase [Bacillus paranthracis]PWN77155.1 integrase [Bacillus cereus]PWN78408.1 integrase [Bacillus cereus]QHH83313.1 tyrosine-type recombinase/integrase [Bacillus paranthracis]UHJ50065.1 tyrosine-type recombinase/integrase [Bacillus paranthracis]
MKRRGELTDEELKIIKKKISDEEAYEKFFKDCYLRNLRPATIGYYKNEFHGAKKIINKQLVEWEQKDVEDLILKSKQLMKVTTINTRLRALRSFYNFLDKNKLIDKNPMKAIKLLRDRQKIIETLDNQEIEKLIKTIRKQKTFVGFRDEVILLVFLDTGVRLSELVGINVEDVRHNKLIIRRTKNLFERTVYLSDTTQERLESYIKVRGEVTTKKLFISQDNKELNPHSIQTRLTKYGKEAKINKRVSPHTFRHTMAKRMIASGLDAFSLMHLLGHTDITVTKRYVNLWGQDLEQKHKEYGALKGLNL